MVGLSSVSLCRWKEKGETSHLMCSKCIGLGSWWDLGNALGKEWGGSMALRVVGDSIAGFHSLRRARGMQILFHSAEPLRVTGLAGCWAKASRGARKCLLLPLTCEKHCTHPRSSSFRKKILFKSSQFVQSLCLYNCNSSVLY